MDAAYIACIALSAGILFNVSRRATNTWQSIDDYHRAMRTLRLISKRVHRQMAVASEVRTARTRDRGRKV